MLKHSKLYFGVIVVLIALGYGSWKYLGYLQQEREKMAAHNYEIQAINMKKRVANMILLKQKSTTAMALSIADNRTLIDTIITDKKPKDYYKGLITKFRQNTLYKNIWIQVLDKDLNSRYRSWSKVKGDSLAKLRKDLVFVAKTKKVHYSVSSGKFDLSIKAIVPIMHDDEFIGIVEVISHFNSIDRQLQRDSISSVVMLEEENSKRLKYPFTKIFTDQYYIANFDAKQENLEYLKKHGYKRYFHDGYYVENGYIVTSYPLRSNDGKALGYYIMFKDVNDISNLDLDFFMFRWFALGVILVMGVMMIASFYLFVTNQRQKSYYKKVINTATNMVIINDSKQIVDVNAAFYHYFSMYNSIEAFKKENDCICDFFVDEEGYLSHKIGDMFWVEYVVSEPGMLHKAKLNIFGDEYYFLVNASLISEEKHHYSVVLSDITVEEKYKQELEYLNITDPLTGIYNRRFFEEKLKEETLRAVRYDHELSFIMFDIDHFKSINDTHGHSVGDQVLKKYTKLILKELRETDIFSRIGGEEFMIILPHAKLSDAQRIAEKIRKKVDESKEVLHVTMSFGVTEYVRGENAEYILNRVDKALYEAKLSGRNKVVST